MLNYYSHCSQQSKEAKTTVLCVSFICDPAGLTLHIDLLITYRLTRNANFRAPPCTESEILDSTFASHPMVSKYL